jgi:hypothetical protein
VDLVAQVDLVEHREQAEHLVLAASVAHLVSREQAVQAEHPVQVALKEIKVE